jgi:Leucine-rich repeat (LRR) protein
MYLSYFYSLEYLYLGGNQLKVLPVELGKLTRLKVLYLCDNQLTVLPKELAKLHQLESLSLHNNNLTALPIAIVKLKNLQAISVRDNPLVIRFVRSQSSSFPSLQELAGKTIKRNRIPYSGQNLPAFLVKYLDSARKCVNSKCRDVFFDSCVRHIRFVDFCGKYRLPFEQFLCSPHDNEQWEDLTSCSSTSSDDDDASVQPSWMKKVLLG